MAAVVAEEAEVVAAVAVVVVVAVVEAKGKRCFSIPLQVLNRLSILHHCPN